MIRYALIYKDEEKQISYFYNLENGKVYSDRIPLGVDRITIKAKHGALLGLILCPIIYGINIALINKFIAMLIMPLFGVFVGLLISIFLIRNNSSFFVSKNEISWKGNKLKQMYEKNNKWMKKYYKMLIGLIVFSFISTIIVGIWFLNFVYAMVIFCLWIIIGIMFFSNRPICRKELGERMKKIR